MESFAYHTDAFQYAGPRPVPASQKKRRLRRALEIDAR